MTCIIPEKIKVINWDSQEKQDRTEQLGGAALRNRRPLKQFKPIKNHKNHILSENSAPLVGLIIKTHQKHLLMEAARRCSSETDSVYSTGEHSKSVCACVWVFVWMYSTSCSWNTVVYLFRPSWISSSSRLSFGWGGGLGDPPISALDTPS